MSDKAGWRSPALGEAREVGLSQGTIRVHETGSGEPIVFVHGLLVDGRLWDQTLPHLDNRRLIVPDWPLGGDRKSVV